MSFGTSLRRYYRGDELVAVRQQPAGQPASTRYYHFDHQGATQCLTDSTGAVTDRFAANAWGVQVKRTGASINRHWYVGNWGYYRASVQSCDYVRLRWYEAPRGAFLSQDPIPWLPYYIYVYNAPASRLDPSGAQASVSAGFEANAFIPGRLGTWLPEPGLGRIGYKFKTDQRGFGGGSSRLFCSGTVSISSRGLSLNDLKCDTGISWRMRPDGSTVSAKAVCLGPGWTITRRLCSPGSNTVCFIEAKYLAHAGYPFVPSPHIWIGGDWTFDIHRR